MNAFRGLYLRVYINNMLNHVKSTLLLQNQAHKPVKFRGKSAKLSFMFSGWEMEE